jgi:hypothetical protein
MLKFPQIRFRVMKTSPRRFIPRLRGVLSVGLAVLLFVAPLSLTSSGQQSGVPKLPKGEHFVFYRDANGEFACREATLAEALDLDQIEPQGLRQINHLADFESKGLSATADNVDNLTIVLRATATLDANAPAKAAFIRAAQVWEAQIKSPITIYLDVHFGPKRADGSDWPSGTIGSTSSPTLSSLYQTVRGQLYAGRSTAAEEPLYNSLPASALPTNQGDATSITVAQTIARAIGLLDPTAQPSEVAPSIGFNSAFSYDFDPNDASDGPGGDGINAGETDFEAVAVHEIGHALGFISRAGRTTASVPAVWDLFRFRTGTTLGTFGSAQRIMTADGLQFYFSGPAEVGLSTGGSDGDAPGGDGRQSSHWRDDSFGTGYVGIMDPTIASGVRRQITANDTIALDSFGYNLSNTNPPPPPPPPPPAPTNNDFANAQVVAGCTGSVTGTNIGANKESGEPSHSPDNNPGGGSVWYQWQAPSSGSVTITTEGSNYDTLLGVYTGASVNALTLIDRNDDVDLGVILSSSVTFSGTAGTVYRIAVDGWGGDAGNIVLNWNAGTNCIPGANSVQFSPGNFSVLEGVDSNGVGFESTGFRTITVTRTGDTSGAASVNYATSNGTADGTKDYEIALGTLRFAPGETSKTFTVFVTDDVFQENDETVNLTLSNPVGTSLGSPAAAVLTITSNDSTTGPNPVNSASFNSPFFVRMHYLDFLNREPDLNGLNHWVGQTTNCGNPDPVVCRINTSAAFFLSIEFKETGYLVYRTFNTAFGPTRIGNTVPITLAEFLPDLQRIGQGVVVGPPGWDMQLELNKQAYFNEFVNRPQFVALYPSSMGTAAFVDALNANAGGALSSAERDQLVNSGWTRAQMLRRVAEDVDLENAQFNRAFVLMQYFGYLRRDPNPPNDPNDFRGYDFWLGKLNQFNGNFVDAQMVLAFIDSIEYKARFGP